MPSEPSGEEQQEPPRGGEASPRAFRSLSVAGVSEKGEGLSSSTFQNCHARDLWWTKGLVVLPHASGN
ncbi:rCG30189, isoform CRA_b, partial [Rattus norvegicus]